MELFLTSILHNHFPFQKLRQWKDLFCSRYCLGVGPFGLPLRWTETRRSLVERPPQQRRLRNDGQTVSHASAQWLVFRYQASTEPLTFPSGFNASAVRCRS